MICKRCKTKFNKKSDLHCPHCRDTALDAIQSVRIVVRPTDKRWYRKLTIYATGSDNCENKIGELYDFYANINFIIRQMQRDNTVVIVQYKDPNSVRA